MKTKNLKVLAMILLTSTLLIFASAASISPAKAATTSTMFLYTTLGLKTVTANSTAMTPGSAPGLALNNGDTYQFQATADSGWKFVCWVYADANGPVASTDNPFSHAINQSCSIEAVFIPSPNETATVSGSGASAITLFSSSGGNTAAGSTAGTIAGASVSGTIGQVTTITQTPATDFKFFCWVVQCSSNTYYDTTTLSYTPTTTAAAIEPIWIPSSSAITLPSASSSPSPTPVKTPEFSAAIVALLAIVLVAVAFGTYAYTKKTRK